jgi:hypothetical protein
MDRVKTRHCRRCDDCTNSAGAVGMMGTSTFAKASKRFSRLLLPQLQKIYAFGFGTESCVELLDTEGLELDMSCIGASLPLKIDCLSKS